ncbi:MAG: PCMD domain-containing protein, partial [Alistipes sp.]|nr:PCMD domain-containing protein [Alistipes sp.]
GKALTHQTAAGAQIPNGDMERWSKPTWWLPYGDGDVAFWLTGNEGGNMASATLTQPSTDVRPGSTGTQSAYLKSQKASVMGIGKFAAGNLFTGTFAMNGLDGIVTFGRDFSFTARPASLSFWMKNNEGTINEGSQASGTDMYTIMVLITDGTTYAVNTKDTSTFLTMDSLATRDGIIAYGYLQGTDSRAEWTQETINITYREDMKSVKPKKIVVSFTPSGYGDYFCGSTSSWMYVDDIVLNY